MSYIFTLTSNVLTFFIQGKPRSVDSSHINWTKLVEIAKGQRPQPSEQELLKLLSVRETIQSQITDARVRLGNDEIIVDGLPVHSYSTDRILEMMRAGIDITPWLKFLERCIENPAAHVFGELFEWLERSNLPVTPEGKFLAYKKVDENYRSYHAHKDGSHQLHEFGTRIEMPRYQVDDVRDNHCSTGMHFANWDYANYSYYAGMGRLLVLEVDPADVVTIPNDYNFAKGRAVGYTPISEVPKEEWDGPSELAGTFVYDAEVYGEFASNVYDSWDDVPNGTRLRWVGETDGTDMTYGIVYSVSHGGVIDDDGFWWNPDLDDFTVVQ